MKNLITPIQMALLDKEFKHGLNSITQEYCQVTLTDDGCRIYRPPNIRPAEYGQSMWGGMKLTPSLMNTNEEILSKGHSYIFLCDVRGQTSRSQGIVGWSNNIGWSGGGLLPRPSNISYNAIPGNFNGEMTHYYKWTIEDDIYKVCTEGYANFIQGKTYLSYKDLAIVWVYEDTGGLGTDIYLSNFRMYDITDKPNIQFNKDGTINLASLEEGYSTASIQSSSELSGNIFYEI